MAQINLLPWREERRQQLKREFLMILVVVAVLGAALVFLADRMVNGQIDYQRQRNNYLSTHIRELDKEVAEIKELQKRRNELIDRMQVIQELQGNRPVIVRIMDQIVRTVPDGVFYSSLKNSNRTITIDGIAESNNRVSSLMRRLDASDWLASPNLDKVQAAPEYGDQANRFHLTVKVELPNSDQQEEGQ
ncbi:PilN domain-containing protein [Haliea sp. E17]|uniref:PilN domain-containing protein n=1 Tax=Haliea sp. E17 TaxID=3401576 RepID=UPI003AAFE126